MPDLEPRPDLRRAAASATGARLALRRDDGFDLHGFPAQARPLAEQRPGALEIPLARDEELDRLAARHRRGLDPCGHRVRRLRSTRVREQTGPTGDRDQNETERRASHGSLRWMSGKGDDFDPITAHGPDDRVQPDGSRPGRSHAEGDVAGPPRHGLDQSGRAGDVSLGAGNQPFGLGRGRFRAGGVYQARWLNQDHEEPPGFGVPEPDQAIPASGRGEVGVVGDGDRILPLGRTGELSKRCARRAVPEPDRAVAPRRDQPTAVATERELMNGAGMPAPSRTIGLSPSSVHQRICGSSPAETNRLPSGCTARAMTSWSWPL